MLKRLKHLLNNTFKMQINYKEPKELPMTKITTLQNHLNEKMRLVGEAYETNEQHAKLLIEKGIAEPFKEKAEKKEVKQDKKIK